MRTDDQWNAWLDELTAQAGRKVPSAFVRDLIFCLRFTHQGDQVIRTMQERKLDYARFAKYAREIRDEKAGVKS